MHSVPTHHLIYCPPKLSSINSLNYHMHQIQTKNDVQFKQEVQVQTRYFLSVLPMTLDQFAPTSLSSHASSECRRISERHIVPPRICSLLPVQCQSPATSPRSPRPAKLVSQQTAVQKILMTTASDDCCWVTRLTDVITNRSLFVTNSYQNVNNVIYDDDQGIWFRSVHTLNTWYAELPGEFITHKNSLHPLRFKTVHLSCEAYLSDTCLFFYHAGCDIYSTGSNQWIEFCKISWTCK